MLVRKTSSSEASPHGQDQQDSDGKPPSRYPNRRKNGRAVFRPREPRSFDLRGHQHVPPPAFSRSHSSSGTFSGSYSSQGTTITASQPSTGHGNVVPLYHPVPPHVQHHGSMFYPPQFPYLAPQAPSSSLTSHDDSSNSSSSYYPSYPSYGYHPFSPPYQQAHSWKQGPPVEYVTDIQPEDVLCGRGGATNSHSGNRAFRSLVKKYQSKYLNAKKRDKPAVASIIVDEIRAKRGRFLRRADTSPQGEVRWVDIGDGRAREKTCQALREGAPELRRKRKMGSSYDSSDESKGVESKEERSPANSSRSSLSVDDDVELRDDDDNDTTSTQLWGKRSRILRVTEEDVVSSPLTSSRTFKEEDQLMIRPCMRLLCQEVPCISLDQLEAEERELYLSTFLPPDPALEMQNQLTGSPANEAADAIKGEDAPEKDCSWATPV